VTFQLYGPDQPGPSPSFPMQGFVVNYELTNSGAPTQIMQTYAASQVPVITSLAREYAVSDAWFCSVPSQTWPNRAFVHAGTSNGNVNNGTIPNPFHWDVTTIFNVLDSVGASWKVYNDALTPSLTRLMFPKLWDFLLDGHFRSSSRIS
jgi:phospholipase C